MERVEADVIGGRMYFPPKDKRNPNDREVFHPETNIKQVLCEDGKQTLEEYLADKPIITKNDNDTQQYAGQKDAIIFQITK